MSNLILIKFENEIIHKESDMELGFITNAVLQEFPKSNFFVLSPYNLQFIQYVKGVQKLNININAGLNLLYDKYPEFITNEIHNIILNIPFDHNQYSDDIDDFKNEISKPIVVDKWKYKIDWWRIRLMYNIDPTHNQKYLNWLCNVDFIDGIDYDEDREKIRNLLKDFDKPQIKALIKKSGYSMDIMDYENNNELFKVVNECYYLKLEDVEAGNRKILYEKRKVFENNDWLVVVPESHQEAVTLGRGTNWCTSADSKENERHYNNYTVDSEGNFYKLYIFINKNNEKEKYQYSELTGDFLDWNDENFNLENIFTLSFMNDFLSKVKDAPFFFKNKLIENGLCLDILVNDLDDHIRYLIASEGLCLDILVNDSSDLVKRFIANMGYGLDILINDESEMVRVIVANKGYGLDILINDESVMIRYKANEFLQEIESGELQPYINDYGFKCYE